MVGPSFYKGVSNRRPCFIFHPILCTIRHETDQIMQQGMTLHVPIHLLPYPSPCGLLLLGSYDHRLCLCDWVASKRHEHNMSTLLHTLQTTFSHTPSPTTQTAARLLDEYFAHRRDTFELPLLTIGTDFQRKVWDALLTVPYGATVTYQQLATRIGHSKSARAVGMAVGSNRISIFLPCHRIVGAGHKLGGFAGGIEAKRRLLQLEADHVTTETQTVHQTEIYKDVSSVASF